MNVKLFSTIFVYLVLLFSLSISAQDTDLEPILISPGEAGNLSIVEQSCPTFSWTYLNWATKYKIVVFKTDSNSLLTYEEMSSKETPVIIKEIKGRATSWTPSSIQRMSTGFSYVWYVQAIDINGTGTWSAAGSYRVEIPVVFSGIEEKLREKLKEQGMTDESLDKVFNDLKSEVKEVVVIDKRKSTASTKPDGVLGSEDTGSGNNVIYGSGAGGSLVLTGGQAAEGEYNSFFGYQAGYSNTSGDFNTFSGHLAGFNNTTGGNNTFIGVFAGHDNLTGNDNTFSGMWAGYSNTSGLNNTFSGYQAGLFNTIGGNNTFSGYQAGYYNIGGANTFLGATAGYSNITGNYNTFLGFNAGNFNTTGTENTYIGDYSGYNNSTGNLNIFIGNEAGYNETGSNKLYIDNSNTTTPLIYGEFDNDIVTINGKLGIGTTTPVFPLEVHTTGSNAKIVINRTDGATGHFLVKTGFATFGTASNHPLRLNVNNIPKVFLLPNGNFGLGVTTPLHPLHLASGAICTASGVWQNASSRDFKENIVSINSDDAFETLKGLEPVTYYYKLEKDELYAGFIAEDVPEMVASKGRKSLGTMDIVAVLTKVTKDQQKKIDNQDLIINNLIKRLEKLEKK